MIKEKLLFVWLIQMGKILKGEGIFKTERGNRLSTFNPSSDSIDIMVYLYVPK